MHTPNHMVAALPVRRSVALSLSSRRAHRMQMLIDPDHWLAMTGAPVTKTITSFPDGRRVGP